MSKKILLIGPSAVSSLELSYARAAKELGFEAIHFDPDAEVKKYIRLGTLGQKLQQFLPVDAWVRKMNRDLVINVKKEEPDIILVFTNVKVLYGTLAAIKTIGNSRIAWIWPDTPLNLAPQNLEAAGLYDCSAIYSEKAVSVFRQIGFSNPHWVPLAGDPQLHGQEPVPGNEFPVDISFVGMWRPEREKMLAVIAENFPQLVLEIYGSYWKDRCGTKSLLKFWKGSGIVGKDLGAYFNRSRISLNVIDDTNFPAANMRFFEIPTAGGLQLCSPCPEQENTFRHREDMVYFRDADDLVNQLQWILSNPGQAARIRASAHKKIQSAHTYTHRLRQILDLLESRQV